jgi:hypothetical protein
VGSISALRSNCTMKNVALALLSMMGATLTCSSQASSPA